jgi:hypothetical protein
MMVTSHRLIVGTERMNSGKNLVQSKHSINMSCLYFISFLINSCILQTYAILNIMFGFHLSDC